MEESILSAITAHLRNSALPWLAAAFLPLPVLLATDPQTSGDIACIYLGIASAWLATELLRSGGLPLSRSAWRTKMLAITIAVCVNVALFIVLSTSVAVQSNIPFSLKAILSATPAIGLVPWLTLRLRQPYAAIILAAMIVAACKLAGCVVARFVYGPNYIAEGYVSDDWHTAKLMITLFWTFTLSISLALLVADYARLRPRLDPAQAQ